MVTAMKHCVIGANSRIVKDLGLPAQFSLLSHTQVVCEKMQAMIVFGCFLGARRIFGQC